MNLFKALKIGAKSAATATPSGTGTRLAREVLPELHAFVDLGVGDGRQRQSISIDAISFDTLTTRSIPGLDAGDSVDFVYSNAYGKHRFSTICAGGDDEHAYFDMPASVKTLQSYGSKRSAVRLTSTLPLQWRYAPGGRGEGEFVKGWMNDLSRGGALLVIDRDVKLGARVEIAVTLPPSGTSLLLVSEVIRVAKIATSAKKSAGIRFVNVDGESERKIDEFIHERQTLRRERGLV